MTPTLLALSRQYMALPGAPEPTLDRTRCDTRENDGLRDANGIRWTRDSDRSAYNLLDLTDAATGGVLATRFPELLTVRTVRDADGNRMHFGSWRRATDQDERTLSPSPYLGEFVARAAMALGRAS